MESNSHKSDYKCQDLTFTSSSSQHSLLNCGSNENSAGCSADDELSSTSLSELDSTVKIIERRINKKVKNYSHPLHQNQKREAQTIPGTKEDHRNLCSSCECNPYGEGQEPIVSNLSISKGQQKENSSDANTCGLKNKCTKWVENEMTKKYGSYFTEDLVFALDVLLLIRNLNELSFRHIIYPTSNSAPKSPCNEKMDDAITLIFKHSRNEFEKEFDEATDGKIISYKNFQRLILQRGIDWEKSPYEAKKFLTFCAMIGQWSVCAEKKGIDEACYFTPLVISRTIYRLKIWGKIPLTFWKDLAEAADDLIQNYS